MPPPRVLLIPITPDREVASALARELSHIGAFVKVAESAAPLSLDLARSSDLAVLVVEADPNDAKRAEAFLPAEVLLSLGQLLAGVGRERFVIAADRRSRHLVPSSLRDVRLLTFDAFDDITQLADVAADLYRQVDVLGVRRNEWRGPFGRRLEQLAKRGLLVPIALFTALYVGGAAWVISSGAQRTNGSSAVVWASAGVLAGLLVGWSLLAQQRSRESTTRDELRELRSVTEHELSSQRRTMARLAESFTAFADPLMGTGSTRRKLSLQEVLPPTRESPSNRTTVADWAPFREITHALNTPLSQVEAAALNLKASAEQLGPEDQATIDRILVSVDVCKVFLDGYATMSGRPVPTHHATQRFIRDCLHGAADLYRRKTQSPAELRFSGAPDMVDPRGRSVLPILLPLLENAYESATAGTDVRVTLTETSLAWSIEISNGADDQPDLAMMFERGHTTKSGHAGLGLTMVSRLVEQREDCTLDHHWGNGQMNFRLTVLREAP